MITELKAYATRLRHLMASGAPIDFNPLALELFELQYRFNPAYRRICDARAASPAMIEHWSRIPSVPTAAFKELDLTCLTSAERTAVFHSSGTTGQQPSRHFHCAASLSLYESSLWPWFQRHLLPDVATRSGSDAMNPIRFIALTPSPEAVPHSSLVHMFETIRRQPGVSLQFVGILAEEGTWAVNLEGVLQSFHGALDTGEPVMVLGTAFSFVHLLDGLADRKLQFSLPSGSCAMETGGYKGRSREMTKPELHALIARRLGIARSHIVCEYGMSELSSQAYDGCAGSTRNRKPETRSFRFPPWCRAQLISPETGREVAEGGAGLIRIFDLANAFSVMAVQTEDLGIQRGDGFELIGRAPVAEPRGCSLMAS